MPLRSSPTMKTNREHTPEAGNPSVGGERFKLPPDVSMHKEPWGDSWADVFRHRRLGELGRSFAGDDGRHIVISCEVAGDPADPMTADAGDLQAFGLEYGTDGSGDRSGPCECPPRNAAAAAGGTGGDRKQAHAVRGMRRDGRHVIFAPDATDMGRFEDYARKMYPQYALQPADLDHRPSLGNGPLMDRPADISR